ncbi:MAG: hypothetical protein WBD00_03140, partial [Candidatus Omnitrophota bacterium]
LYDMRVSDKDLLYLVSLFNGKNTIKNIQREFFEKTDHELSKEDLYKVVWLLYCQKLILFKNDINIFRRK